MNQMIAIEQWPARLQTVLVQRCAFIRQATVLFETDSTQQSARRLNARPGEVIVAWRQTHGHGRLGRSWADTKHDGIALTVVTNAGPSERLAIASAIGTARGIEAVLGQTVGIKWPNDIMAQQRKLAGILIEQTDSIALIGIGINVSQTQWPDDLSEHAISLAQLDLALDRLIVLEIVLPALDAALQMGDAELIAEFAKRDVLRGRVASFRMGSQTFTGRVLAVDPMKGLTIQTDEKQIWLPAATTTLNAASKINGISEGEVAKKRSAAPAV